MNRRSFMKLGALLVPAVAAPTVAYSFLWKKTAPRIIIYLPGGPCGSLREFKENIDLVNIAGEQNVYKMAKMSPTSVLTTAPHHGAKRIFFFKKTGADEWSISKTETWQGDKLIDVHVSGAKLLAAGAVLVGRTSFGERVSLGV
jgi:hypothetical protein